MEMNFNFLKEKFSELKLERKKFVTNKIMDGVFVGWNNSNNIVVFFEYKNMSNTKPIMTKNLKIIFNAEIQIKYANETKVSTFTIIELLSNEKETLEYFQFFIFNLIVCYNSLIDFSSNLVNFCDLFESKRVIREKSLTGLFGELLFLKFCLKMKFFKILDFWHSKNINKFDFEISTKLKLEIKTTTNSYRIHKFSHEQVNVSSYNQKIIGSIILYKADKGLSLFRLINNLKRDFGNNSFNKLISEYMKKFEIDEINEGFTIDYEKSINSIKFFDAFTFPKIDKIPDDIFNIKYELSMHGLNEIKEIQEILSWH